MAEHCGPRLTGVSGKPTFGAWKWFRSRPSAKPNWTITQGHGQAPAEALDEVLADALAWERQDYSEAVAAVTKSYEDVKAGRTQPAREVLEELRVKNGLPR